MPITFNGPQSYRRDHRINSPVRMMVGALTPTSAAFNLDCQSKATLATFKVATDVAMTSEVFSQSISTTEVPGQFYRVGRIDVPDLDPGTKYYYTVNFGFQTPPAAHSFTTPPEEGTRTDSSFVFSSCCTAVGTTSWRFARNIATDAPDFWAHCGDYGYAINPLDITTLDESHVQTTQRQMDSCADIELVHKTIPVVSQLQNHDRVWALAQWGDTSDDGELMQDVAELGAEVYQTRFPHHPLRDPSGYCLGQIFSWANARFYMWDTISQRDAAGGTTLGDSASVYRFNQLDDFLTQLAADDASGLYDVAFFLNSSTWQSDTLLSFEEVSPDEIDTILEAVGNLENMLAILVSGDSHQWGIDDGTYTSIQYDPTVRLPQITSSGLRQSDPLDVAGPWEWRGSPLEGFIGEVDGFGGHYALIGVEHTAGAFARVRMAIRATPDNGTGLANDFSGAVTTLAEVTTDEETNEVSFLDDAPTVASLGTLTVTLEKSWLGACSVDYACSHGPSGTVTFGPNRRRTSFDVIAPASGTFDITLSDADGCSIVGTNPVTATVI